MTSKDWAVPETEVLDGVREAIDGASESVLVTVVRVEGSAYRRPGAKMLFTGDESVGHVTAGCLESEFERVASEVRTSGKPRVERYDLSADGDDVWGLGIGCNGVVDLLFEFVDESHRPLVDAYESGDDVGVVTVLDAADESAVGARAYYHPEREEFETDDSYPSETLRPLRDAVVESTRHGQSETFELGEATVFVDGVSAPPNLVVVGSGHDVDPVVELGAKAGFRVSVVAYRGASSITDRLPESVTVHTTSPGAVREAVDFDRETYVVVASHNFVDDRLTVETLVGTPVPYVGVMGPKKRYEQMLDALEDEGVRLEPSERERLYTPVGLNLGGGSPYQIALSIVSEVLAVRNGREPGHLAERAEPIHDRVEL
ncbi:XdhC family protein [Halogeometricum limi]|uniref:Xanthine dehydrogenase accessory factor n=1 Tax=Halogeometricum limi TaxID=555875 RepID=A0A1I6ICK3_9EURY|nr:XdhC/CoxI family protein [Halogeometricum limi]SFR64416.1 xanthine dehydrogenase accessory factor [Halogeometricum limi]